MRAAAGATGRLAGGDDQAPVRGLAGVLLAVVWVGLLLAGPLPARAASAGVISLGLVVGAALSSRALGQCSPALLLGIAAVPYAALGAFFLPSIADPVASAHAETAGVAGFAVGDFGGSQVFSAGAVAAVVAILVLLLVDVASWVFLAAVVTMIGVGLGGLLSVWFHIDALGSAGLVGAIASGLASLPQPPRHG
jgi:hypothetical protein